MHENHFETGVHLVGTTVQILWAPGGERLQEWAPTAKVVKAFNTPGVPNIRDPRRAGGHVSIPMAGTDVAAKTRVAALVTALGLEPVDTGPLVAARSLEALMRLSFGYFLYTKGKASFEYHLAPVAALL